MSIRTWLRHAFAVQTDPPPITRRQHQLVERMCREIVRRHLTTPALAFAEMSRPLNYLGSQTMQFFLPIASTVFNTQDYVTFAEFLERRDSIDTICMTLENLEQNASKPCSEKSHDS